MKLFSFLNRKKRKILELQEKLENSQREIQALKNEVNNYRAITAIGKKDFLRSKDRKNLLNRGFVEIEQWDLRVDFLFIPLDLEQVVSSFSDFKKGKIWKARVVFVDGLSDILLFSNFC